MLRHLFLALSLIVGLASCTKYEANREPPASTKNAEPPSPGQTIAYEQYISVSTEPGRIGATHRALQASCEQAAAAEQCVILESELRGSDATSAFLKLRATTAGVARLMNELTAKATLTMQQLRGEELAAPIGDARKRLQLSIDYRSRLEALAGNLGNKSGADLDSLVRLNHELAQVQSQIETASGELARLQERVATRILTVQIDSIGPSRVWAPLGDAFADFGHDLAGATGALITFLAYALPWCIVLAGAVWGLLKWRAHRARRAAAPSAAP